MNPATAITTKTQESKPEVLTLAEQIGALHRDIEGRSEEMFGLLTQAKKDAGEDGWLKWLAAHREVLGFGERQARRYLREPDARVSDRARHAEGERKRRATTKAPQETTTESLPITESQTVEVRASQNGLRGVVTFEVTWTDTNGEDEVRAGFRTLEEALKFCPRSMDPDTVARVVIPGVRVNNPMPRDTWGHNGSYMMLDGQRIPGSGVPPNLHDIQEDEDEPEVLPETEPPVTNENTVKAPANEQPATKKLRYGSRPWFKERVAHLWEAVRDLREAVPELQGTLYSQKDHNLFRSIVAAQEALGHVVRIASNPVEVKKVSLAVVKLWNQQKGEQLEGKYCSEYLMSKINEAVACELDLDRWARVVETIAWKDPSWFTRDNFNDLISTRDGRPDGLEDLEKQQGLPAWGPAVSESVEMPAGTPGAGS